ncbi:MAG: NAD(+) synthase, partial [Methanomicrobiales archaeon]|nr:NAD(+) synthase [Methanomicrobiales archaeon]
MHCELECEVERIEDMMRHVLWSSGGRGVIVGVSGGVDSAVAAALCKGALGKERVKGLLLPAAVSRAEDIRDAEEFCAHLDIQYTRITIQPILDTYRKIPGFVKDPVLE